MKAAFDLLQSLKIQRISSEVEIKPHHSEEVLTLSEEV